MALKSALTKPSVLFKSRKQKATPAVQKIRMACSATAGGGGGTYHVSEFFRVRNFVPLARIVDTCEEIHMPSPARLSHGLHVLTQRDYMDILEV